LTPRKRDRDGRTLGHAASRRVPQFDQAQASSPPKVVLVPLVAAISADA
jgi:hypothetical protein